MKPEILVFIFSSIAYSLATIFLFAQAENSSTFEISLLRSSFLLQAFDLVCLFAAFYLILSMLGVRAHKSCRTKQALFCFGAVIAYLMFACQASFNELYARQVLTQIRVYITPNDRIYTVALFGLTALALLIFTWTIVSSYRRSEDVKHKTPHLIVLVAFLLHVLSYLLCMFYTIPILVAMHGVLLFAVIMVVLQKPRLFDLKSAIPGTLDNRCLRRVRHVFRSYADDTKGYRETVETIEKTLIEYKLAKASRFRDQDKSVLPAVASNLGLSLSSLYDQLKRLNIQSKE